MKKIKLNHTKEFSGGGLGQDFVGGVTCGWGLATMFTPFMAIGAVMAMAGCGTLIGNW